MLKLKPIEKGSKLPVTVEVLESSVAFKHDDVTVLMSNENGELNLLLLKGDQIIDLGEFLNGAD